ncbi:MAG: hypothetical protein ACREEW_05375 [Caulobacteraceae bacterium]
MNAVPKPSHFAAPFVRRHPGEEGMMAVLTRLAEEAEVPPTRLMADLAALALGPGRIALSDYERLRLHDHGFWGEADRREVAGARRARDLCLAANFRRDWFALASDSLASSLYLAVHGLPAVPVLGIYRAGLAAPGELLLRTREELRAFLAGRVGEPLSACAEGRPPRVLFAHEGRDPEAEIDRLIDEARDTPGVGWVFRPLVAPHPKTPRGDGETQLALAPVRLLTMAGGKSAAVFGALWRLGGPDQLVASIDLKTGEAIRLAPAAAPERAVPAPPGLAVPDWRAVKAAATEGGRLFRQFGLLGWDVAPGAEGPVILGLDPTPDLGPHQLLERRGVLDSAFLAFLDERRRLRAEWRRAATE